jgi:enoyl-CoA hydratase/carnithine racemase
MEYETFLFHIEDHIAVITFNRPERMNAWTTRVSVEISQALADCDKNDDVRAVVITGQGRAFCAGTDLSFQGDSSSNTQDDIANPAKGFPTVQPWEIHKPVLAAINGHAIGVGITYAMSCDFRIVAENAKVQFAFVRRGIVPELASHVIVSHIAGFSRAADLLLTGRTITGRELAEMGLASAALPAEQVLPAVMERAREFLLAAPVSVAISKQLLWESLGMGVREMYEREKPLFSWTVGQPDAVEGVMAFLEKRSPNWKMRVSQDLPDLLRKREIK